MKSTHAFGIFCCIPLVIMAGCWSSSSPPAPPPAVEYDDGPVLTYRRQQAGQIVVVAPDGAPADKMLCMPLGLIDFEVAEYFISTHEPGGQVRIFRSSAPIDEVREFYADRFTKGGWRLNNENSSGTSHCLVAGYLQEKVTMFMDADEQGTMVTVSYKHH